MTVHGVQRHADFCAERDGRASTTPPTGTITVNPGSLTFGSQEVGTTSATPQLLTVNVTGTNPVTLNFPEATGTNAVRFFGGTGDDVPAGHCAAPGNQLHDRRGIQSVGNRYANGDPADNGNFYDQSG